MSKKNKEKRKPVHLTEDNHGKVKKLLVLTNSKEGISEWVNRIIGSAADKELLKLTAI